MKSMGRSRSFRGNASPVPAEAPGREREPFCLGPFRQQKSFSVPSTPPRSRSRANGENVPPDNNHTAAYVKANTPDSSPAQPKSSKKVRNGGVAPLPGSPALLPRPPASKPVPAGSTASKSEPQIAHTEDSTATTKRKLSWDVNGGATTDNIVNTSIADTTGADSGVKVIIRMRPLNCKEEQEEATQVVQKISAGVVALADQQFTYDAVAGEDASQQDMFEMVGLPMVENCLAGFNSSIFAYGQTGSGKTHTMMGVATDPDSKSSPSEARGLIPRVFERLFSRMQQEEKANVDKGLTYQCRCSFLEIYNEQVTDLLEPSQKNLQIREDTKTGVYVDSLSEEFVSNADDVTRLLLKGLMNRRTGATTMNSESSRSHSVFTCVIESRFKNLAEGGNSVRSSRMNLVDLAGSERQKQTGAAGERLKEAGNINKSLSQLGNVINILAEVAQTGKQRHIPYRDSRLTFLLQESLGGNAKLAMICAISLASSCRSESLSTLRFAQRAKAIQNKAVVNEETANDVGLLREQIRQLKDELMRMKSNGNQDAGAGGYSNGWNARRSYNLLRLSLSHPLSISSADFEDTDLEMEIDEDDRDSEPESTLSISAAKEATRDGASRLPVIEEKDWLLEDTSMDIENAAAREARTEDATNNTSEMRDASLEMPSTPVKDYSLASGLPSSPNTEDDRCDVVLESIRTPELVKTPELTIPRTLHSPPLSVSPRLKGTVKWGLSGSPLAPRPESAVTSELRPSLSKFEEIYHSTQDRFYDSTITSQSLQLKSGSLTSSALRTSFTAARPTEKLAASLHRGLQILDNQQRSSTARRSTAGLRFSIQSSDCQIPRSVDKIDKEVQTCSAVFVTSSTSPLVVHSTAKLTRSEYMSSCTLELALKDDCAKSDQQSPNSQTTNALREVTDDRLKMVLCLESLGDLAEEPENHLLQLSPSLESFGDLVQELNQRSGSGCAQLQLYPELERPKLKVPPQEGSLPGITVQEPDIRCISEDVHPHLSTSGETQGALLSCSEDGHRQVSRLEHLPGSSIRELNSRSPSGNVHLQLSSSQEEQLPKTAGRLQELSERSDSDTANCTMSPICKSTEIIGFDSQDGRVQLLPCPEFPANPVQDPDIRHLQQPSSTQSPRNFVDEPQLTSVSTYHTPNSIPSKSCDTSQWQLVTLEVPKSSSEMTGHGKSPQLKLAQAVEALLAGAIRRERLAEEAMSKQAAEIEQLNRLVRQYRHERECNAILSQTREDKISRLESLMDNIIPTDAFLNEEWSGLLLEHKMLQSKFDNHPEVTQSSVEQQRLLDELNSYRTFFELGEREILIEEIAQLRNQLQIVLEHSGTPSSSARQRRLSLARMSLQTTKFSEAATECPSPSSLALLAIPPEGLLHTTRTSSDLSIVAANNREQRRVEEKDEAEAVVNTSQQLQWEEEKREMEVDWEERERDWMAVLEELREETESYRRQAEKRKQELECEKRCSEEMQEALQMAMTGHARLLEQYAELQEKHIGLLAKQRKIKEGTADIKKMAKRAGVTSGESKWLEAQALQTVLLRVEYDEERRKTREEMEGLQEQLRDTADAVQAAGELLVRLKEAEESVIIAQEAAAMAEQDAGGLRREMEKVRRRNATEMATLQQRLLESRLQKTAVCPMCVMAERVKFQFTEVDPETAQAALEAEARAMALKEEREWMALQRQKAAENQSQHEDDYELVWTGEELLGQEEEELHMNEFDELDHLFTAAPSPLASR